MPEVANELDYSALRFWLDVIQWFLTAIVAAWLVLTRGKQDNSEAIDKLDKRVQKLETQQELMPTHDDVSAVKEAVSSLRSDIKAQTRQLALIQDHLLNRKG